MFDDTSKADTKNYRQAIFKICGYAKQGEPYLMDSHSDNGFTWNLPKGSNTIEVSTGCGGR
jgi:hypothetical protein